MQSRDAQVAYSLNHSRLVDTCQNFCRVSIYTYSLVCLVCLCQRCQCQLSTGVGSKGLPESSFASVPSCVYIKQRLSTGKVSLHAKRYYVIRRSLFNSSLSKFSLQTSQWNCCCSVAAVIQKNLLHSHGSPANILLCKKYKGSVNIRLTYTVQINISAYALGQLQEDYKRTRGTGNTCSWWELQAKEMRSDALDQALLQV